MNFTTDLPKQDPICSYLVATGKVEDECYRMHVVVNSQEYSKEYRKSEVLKELKHGQNEYERSNPNRPQEKEKQKLLPQDRVSKSERIIVCHVTKIKSFEQQPPKIPNDNFKNKRDSKLKLKKRKSRKAKQELICETDQEESSSHNEQASEDSLIREFGKENILDPNQIPANQDEDFETQGIFNPTQENIEKSFHLDDKNTRVTRA